MATLNVSIAANIDDGYELEGFANWQHDNTGTNAITFGSFNAVALYHPGFRFDGVTVPQGSVINSATITLYQAESSVDSPTGTWYAWDTDDASAFDATTNYPTTVTKTTATGTWVNAGSGTFADVVHTVTTIVQEIVDRGSWVSGNAINLFCIADTVGSDVNIEAISDFANTSPTVAELDIDYTDSNPSIEVTAGSMSMSGQSIDLLEGFSLEVNSGSLSMSGQSVDMVKTEVLAVTPGSLTMTGESVVMFNSADLPPSAYKNIKGLKFSLKIK